MIFSRLSSLRVVYVLPLLFMFAFSIVCLSSQPTYAGTGYLTGNLDDFDGFINSNPFYTNSWPQFSVYGNKNSYNGFTGNLPQLCKPQNSNTTSNCNSNWTQGGTNYNTWTVGKLSTPVNGYDLKGIERLYLTNSMEVPNSWKGHKVAITLYLGFYEQGPIDPDTGALTYTNHVPTWVEMNWGAMGFVNRGSSGTCNDYITNRMLTTPVTGNDFVVFELDYTNVTKDMTCNIHPQWGYVGNDAHGYGWYSNFDVAYTVVVHNPYVGWDIIEEGGDSCDDVVSCIDDWKDQQGEEVNEIKDNASAAGTTANGILSVFQFTVLDPLASFWSLFSDGSCVNIPIVGGLINMEGSTQVCSWWPASIRAITTPVFTSAGTLLLWGFVMKWLRDDGTMAEIESGSAVDGVYQNDYVKFRKHG